jgi:hypothetical protein
MGGLRGLAGLLWRWLNMSHTWEHEGPFDIAAAQASGQSVMAAETHGQTVLGSQIYIVGAEKGQVDA